MPMIKRQHGFAHLGAIFIILSVIVVIVIVGLQVAKRNPADLVKKVSKIVGSSNDTKTNGWLDKCEGDDRKPMTHLPMDMENVATFTPYGLTAGAHVTPIDHLYFYPNQSERDKYPVYAMADGYIVEIGSRGVMVDTGAERPPEYRIIFQHSCQTISYFDLVTKLDDTILKATGEFKPNDTKNNLRIPVKAGQEIGRIGSQSLDTAVYNFSMTLKGFIHPKMYETEFWKVHTDDFYSYFSQVDQDQMQAKNRRKVKPYSGKIDYDQPGKLIGNWFKAGSNGYAGPKETQNKPGVNKQGSWSGHLAIFYDAIVPSSVVVSLGDYLGEPKSFAVLGNSPDPANISAESGIVIYQLVQAPNSFNPVEKPSNYVVATILFQVMPDEKLKMEVFPGKTAGQVSDFTPDAINYER